MKNQINRMQEGTGLTTIRCGKDAFQTAEFLGMVLQDRTGEIGGVMWNNATDTAKLFEVGDVVNVRGLVASYQGRLQVRIEQVVPMRESDYSMSDLVNKPENLKEIASEFETMLSGLQNPYCKQLCDAFWQDDEFRLAFTQAMAGKKWHHEYTGGLLQHCHEMMRIAATMRTLPELDRCAHVRRILMTSENYTMSHGLAVEYTTEGKLLGHLHIGC